MHSSEDSVPQRGVPMSSPDLTDAERQAVLEVLQTRRLSIGPQLEAFERAVAEYVGARHAIGVSSGTAALHLAVRALGIGDTDRVITTPFSFVASANVLLYERAVPVFVDVDPRTGNLDSEQVQQAAEALDGHSGEGDWLPPRGAPEGGQLKAVLTVDVFGQPADYDALQAVAQAHDLRLIEDSCEALGAVYRQRPAGTLGDLGAFAFYPNKQITTGEGGMIVTQDDELAGLVRSMRNQGRAPGDTWLEHTYLGYNYRMSELNAALGRVQMGRLDELLERREQVAGWYQERLDEIPRVERLSIMPSTTRMSWFVYVIRLDADVERGALAQRLEKLGIPSRPYFRPIHLQPFYRERFGYEPGAFPVAEDLGRRSLALPYSGVMTEAQVDQVCAALREALAAS